VSSLKPFHFHHHASTGLQQEPKRTAADHASHSVASTDYVPSEPSDRAISASVVELENRHNLPVQSRGRPTLLVLTLRNPIMYHSPHNNVHPAKHT